jgi:hypothetical protein
MAAILFSKIGLLINLFDCGPAHSLVQVAGQVGYRRGADTGTVG